MSAVAVVVVVEVEEGRDKWGGEVERKELPTSPGLRSFGWKVPSHLVSVTSKAF